ncbi:phosphatidate cytidylyltransferase [Bythopirellula polymerisocia]|uniref:Phosphatidate cytidylyltransferase n=1 Tax=Bythopirellula polymerisocia TaxID=2528003 RepID=A0A5C6CY67_9BACT|nr:phosphatidate cytidylyltransferase [Bythopirellula polymerisocia]TWU28524.1 Phosphatidate cytidylyltransferase [Bythopirellula polymerisocia]
MLRWRLIIGTVLVCLLLGLCWLDAHAKQPGIYLFPLVAAISLLATAELIRMFRALGYDPLSWALQAGTLLAVLGACVPIAWQVPDSPVGSLGFLAGGMIAGLVVNIVAEMLRYRQPGKTIMRIALASFTVLYLGGLLGFLVQLRLLPVDGNVSLGGMLVLFSMIAVVKFTDIGAYFAGRIWGRHKMAPVLSPGKTWEGAAGGMLLAVVASLFCLGPLGRMIDFSTNREWPMWLAGAVGYGFVVGLAGMLGDLAESLLKRDAGVKDSSDWLPGFGGVLDLMDSLLIAGPVAYLLWVSGWVGP